VSIFKTPLKIVISKEWALCQIDGGKSEIQKTRLSISRIKLKIRYSSTAHEFACLILNEKKNE